MMPPDPDINAPPPNISYAPGPAAAPAEASPVAPPAASDPNELTVPMKPSETPAQGPVVPDVGDFQMPGDVPATAGLPDEAPVSDTTETNLANLRKMLQDRDVQIQGMTDELSKANLPASPAFQQQYEAPISAEEATIRTMMQAYGATDTQVDELLTTPLQNLPDWFSTHQLEQVQQFIAPSLAARATAVAKRDIALGDWQKTRSELDTADTALFIQRGAEAEQLIVNTMNQLSGGGFTPYVNFEGEGTEQWNASVNGRRSKAAQIIKTGTPAQHVEMMLKGAAADGLLQAWNGEVGRRKALEAELTRMGHRDPSSLYKGSAPPVDGSAATAPGTRQSLKAGDAWDKYVGGAGATG